MTNSNLKNIVVLNNLPSNLIEEAIIVLKSSKYVKKLELIDMNSSITYKKNKDKRDYVIKEAENIVSNYIAKIEKNQNVKIRDINIEKKYKRIKIYSIIISFLLIFCVTKIIFWFSIDIKK